MSATALRLRSLCQNRLVLGPGLSLDVEGVNIIIRNTCVVQTTVTTIHVELPIIITSTRISSRWWCTDCRRLVNPDSFVTKNAGPGKICNFQPPTVIESLYRTCMASIDEDSVESRCY